MNAQRIIVRTPEGGINEFTFNADSIIIGKDDECDIVIKGWSIGRQHAEIRFTEEGAHIHSRNALVGIGVNGVRIKAYGPLLSKDEIQLAGYSMFVLGGKPREGKANDAPKHDLAREIAPRPRAPILPTPVIAANTASDEGGEAATPSASGPSAQMKTLSSKEDEAAQEQKQDHYMEWRRKVHGELLNMMDVRRTDITKMSEDELETATRLMIDVVLESLPGIPKRIDRGILAEQVLHEAIGLGPLEPLLSDESVTEVMVNAYDQIFVERAGKITRSPVFFSSDKAVLSAIERIVSPLGRKIDESSPLVDARLKDGSRVNAVIPPLALKGPCITIRKFAKHRLYGEDLIKFDTLDEGMLEFLSFSVRQAQNIVISGGTGSGKTTLLNILSNFIPNTDRIVTVEDAAELRLHQPNLVSLEAKPPNSEGKGAIPIRELVKNCLRMRPDRIVVGECRGGEALDMLQAMNTGHDGSLTTGHANSARDMLSRLEVMVLMAGMDLPVTAIREQIASAVNLIVQQTRFKCGSRKITSITEVTGVEGGRIQLQDIFVYVRDGYEPNGRIKGHFAATGAVPEFLEDLLKAGVKTPSLNIFEAAGQHD
ncbi:MAG: Flp pilus assembly complex ATPase component TadA [Zoogloeaceae bacterium]|jgi:pilus assembly protein CpaF|nr:Flp pilus assembly complex ATPase component TadA [Zoogloeaceae bacterium]